MDLSKIPIDLLLNILNIVLLFLIVRKLAYKPIRKFMDARTARVNAEAEAAAQKAAEAEKMKAEYAALLENGEEAQKQQAEQARKAAQAEADKIISDANEKAAGIYSMVFTVEILFVVVIGAIGSGTLTLTGEATGKKVIALPIEATALGNLKIQFKSVGADALGGPLKED